MAMKHGEIPENKITGLSGYYGSMVNTECSKVSDKVYGKDKYSRIVLLKSHREWFKAVFLS